MRILRLRRGFQADHSSSSYLFYAADQPVGPEGQAIAHRFSSRAEVGKRTARYEKWGESGLSYSAYKALLEKHYDVMVSESYGWWSMLIAVPKTAQMQRLLAPFSDARGGDDLGVSVEDYGQRLAIEVSCSLVDEGADFSFGHDDVLAYVAKLLVRIRDEILAGNTSFLSAVASFYGADEEGSPGPEPSRRFPHAASSDLTASPLPLGIRVLSESGVFWLSASRPQPTCAARTTPLGTRRPTDARTASPRRRAGGPRRGGVRDG